MKDRIKNISDFHSVVVNEGHWSDTDSFRQYLQFIFQDVTTLEGKTILDIGGGVGLLSFYAAIAGAKQVICLEPEFEGSTADSRKKFSTLKTLLKIENVTLVNKTFQEFKMATDKVDLFILHNSINHLDEWACIHLHNDELASNRYKKLFHHLESMASSQAEIILADCTPYNIFPLLRIPHPINRTIEWHKHQPPSVWIKFLQDIDFKNPKIRWNSYRRLGKIGHWLFANRLAAFFMTGHFQLHMRRES